MLFSSCSRKEEAAGQLALSQNSRTALDFFTTAFIWFDILSCTTTGSKPSCNEWLLSLIHEENGNLQLRKLMGCQNWVMVIIMEIAALDYWKRGCQVKGSLDMRELTQRTICIEKRLNYGLAGNAKLVLSHGLGSRGSPEWETRSVTDVFACSALTYLHVVLSGPYPELPEIRSSVDRTICALQALHERHWIHRLAWPFCVAGSMALPQSQIHFRNLACDAVPYGQGFKSLKIAVAIVEQCWAVRREGDELGSRVCDWRIGMKNLGLSVLLI